MSAGESKKLNGDVVVGSSAGSSLITVESLRGRLLTERQASRVANEEAELLENKLKELESKLKEEIKLRWKAEKRLKFLMRKLHSLNITFTLDLNSSSSDCSGLFSSTASSSITTTSSSASANTTEEDESPLQRTKTANDDDDDQSSSTRVPATESISLSRELKMDSDTDKAVEEVLEPLRHAREKTEKAMDGRKKKKKKKVMCDYSWSHVR